MPTRAGLSSERVIETAVRLLEEEGAASLTMARLARELGVKTPSLYNHVGGVEELQRSMRLRGLLDLGDRLRRATVGRSAGEALRSLAQAYREFASEQAGLYGLTLGSTVTEDEELQEAGREIVEVAYAVLAGYGLAHDDAVHATRILRSALHGFVSLESGGGFGMPQDTDETFERLLAHLDAGLRSRVEAHLQESDFNPGSDRIDRRDR